MLSIPLFLTVVMALGGHVTSACYQDCTAAFTHKIQQMSGVTDSATLTRLSCQAMSHQIKCLEDKQDSCDATSRQYVTGILGSIRPDYQRSCSDNASSDNTTDPSERKLLTTCTQRAMDCYSAFNDTFLSELKQEVQNVTALCQSLDNYTLCVEDLIAECGQFMSQAIASIKSMQEQYSTACADSHSPETGQCVNETVDCFEAFSNVFTPAVRQYLMSDACSSLGTFTDCLSTVHERPVCQPFAKHAMVGVQTLSTRYSMFCGHDGGLQAQQCLIDFQRCYVSFNFTYFPALHSANMAGICSAVTHYAQCTQHLYADCGRHIAQALASVRVMKEQMALQCDPEYQRLASCKPLLACLNKFAATFSPETASSLSLCPSLASYFPCVEEALAECSIPPEDTSVDFSQLGSLIVAYCQHLLGNSVLKSCTEFSNCTSGIVLVSHPDPSAMFDADTWCGYMDMSLSCVQRAVNTASCGLASDDTILGHLTQQREHKRNICKLASVPEIPTEPPNTAGGDGHSDGDGSGHKGSNATPTRPEVTSLILLAVASLGIHYLS